MSDDIVSMFIMSSWLKDLWSNVDEKKLRDPIKSLEVKLPFAIDKPQRDSRKVRFFMFDAFLLFGL